MTFRALVPSRQRLIVDAAESIERGESVVLLGRAGSGRYTVLEAVRVLMSSQDSKSKLLAYLRWVVGVSRDRDDRLYKMTLRNRPAFQLYLGPGFMHGDLNSVAHRMMTNAGVNAEYAGAGVNLRLQLRELAQQGTPAVVLIYHADALHQVSNETLDWLRSLALEGTPILYTATEAGWANIRWARPDSRWGEDVRVIAMPEFTNEEAADVAANIVGARAKALAPYIAEKWPARIVEVARMVRDHLDYSPLGWRSVPLALGDADYAAVLAETCAWADRLEAFYFPQAEILTLHQAWHKLKACNFAVARGDHLSHDQRLQLVWRYGEALTEQIVKLCWVPGPKDTVETKIKYIALFEYKVDRLDSDRFTVTDPQDKSAGGWNVTGDAAVLDESIEMITSTLE